MRCDCRSPAAIVQIGRKKWVIVSDYSFEGTDRLTLDAKGRVTMPARHRQVLGAIANDELTITRNHGGCLKLFPRPAWFEFRAKLLTLPVAANEWRRVFMGSAMSVSVDGASRVLISPELRKFAALDREVLLVGMGKTFELWDATRFEAQEALTFQQPMPDSLMNMVE